MQHYIADSSKHKFTFINNKLCVKLRDVHYFSCKHLLKINDNISLSIYNQEPYIYTLYYVPVITL